MALSETELAYRRKYNSTPKGKASRKRYKDRMRQERPAEYKRRCMAEAARKRARAGGYPAELHWSDIPQPEVCPALGIPLCWDGSEISDESPTLDKLVPELGYVPGNIAVLSHKANNIKHNATADEIQLVADWLKTKIG